MTMRNKLYIIFGLFIFIFMFYNRLIYVRIPKDLPEDLIFIQIIIYTCLIINTFLILLNNIYKIYKKINKLDSKEPSKFTQIFIKIIQHPWNPINIWTNSLISLDAFIINNLPMYNSTTTYGDFIIQNIAQVLIKYKKYSLKGLLYLQVICQTIVCILFIIDVIYYNKFDYFYKMLWLLLISMLISYIIYSIRINTTTYLRELNDILVIKVIHKDDLNPQIPKEDINNNSYIKVTIDEFFDIQTHYQATPEDIITYQGLTKQAASKIDPAFRMFVLTRSKNSLYMFLKFRTYLKEYDSLKESIELPINIIKYTLYLISWSYVLIVGII